MIEPWPRLDPGAVLCKSRDDLVGFQTNNAATADCTVIQRSTAIAILGHDGPSRTHVAAKDASQDGWTNAFLPATQP